MRPNETFVYQKNNSISADLKQVTRLYLPLIGPVGLSVYAYLLAFQDEGEKAHLFSHILAHLQIEMSEFEYVLTQLIALQLVDFTQLETGIYQIVLRSPLDSRDFFRHQVLTNLLERRLGESQVKELKPASDSVAKSFNHSLATVYGEQEPLHLKSRESTPSDFDLQHFKQLMARDGLRFADEQADLLSLYEYAEKSNKTWYETYQLAKETAAGHLISTKRLLKTLQVSPEPQGEFSAAELSLIRWVKDRQPLAFLADLKQSRQASITSSERQLIKDLIQLGLLDEVINVALFYTFQKVDSANINEKYALKLANDLSYQGINSPEAAIRYLRQEKNTEGNPQTSKKVQNKAALSNIPEWSKESYRTEATPEELEELQALRRRMLGEKEN